MVGCIVTPPYHVRLLNPERTLKFGYSSVQSQVDTWKSIKSIVKTVIPEPVINNLSFCLVFLI